MAIWLEAGPSDQEEWFQIPGTRRNGRLIVQLREGTKWTAEKARFLNGLNSDPEPELSGRYEE